MDPIQHLVRDFAAQLAGVTKAFEERISASQGDAPARMQVDLPMLAATILAKRRSRRNFFSGDLFHEPAWDMLLALYVARAEGRTLFVKALVASTDAPATTSQRWIDHLHRLRLVDRLVDPDDRRRIEISLSESGQTAMTAYLESIVRSESIR